MAKKKQEEEAKPGSPAWMTTFGDLMNLLLCFFVLLFSMSTVDAEKFEMLVTSLQSSFSILPAGGSSVGEGSMVSSGISQLENLDIFFKENTNSGETDEDVEAEKNLQEQFEKVGLAESEKMAEDIEVLLQSNGIGDKIEVDVNAQFVQLTLNGAILFDSGKADIREDALPLVNKLSKIIATYVDNSIIVEGHTDNVQLNTDSKFENNDILSSYRALSIKEYLLENSALNPAMISFTGYGENRPVADNGSEEGRARNRRVEIKIFNSYNSY